MPVGVITIAGTGVIYLFRKDGESVAGLGRLVGEGARTAWTVYIRVADAEAPFNRGLRSSTS